MPRAALAKRRLEVCYVCGKKLVQLARHLRDRHNLPDTGISKTPPQTREENQTGAGEAEPPAGGSCADDTSQQTPSSTDHSSEISSNEAPASAESSTEEDENTLPASITDEALSKEARVTMVLYFKHILGTFPSVKRRQNAQSTLQRVVSFLKIFHSTGGVDAGLTGLRSHGRLNTWLDKLKARKLAPTTIKNYALDIGAFLCYLSAYKPVTIPNKVILRLRLKLALILKDQRRAVRIHRDKQYTAVRDTLLTGPQLSELVAGVRGTIPRLLERMELETTHRAANRLAASFTVYLTALNGCRRGTWINLRAEDVQQATEKDGRRLVSVAEHKTAHIHGEAVITLTEEEYSWLLRYKAASERLPGYR